MDVQALQDKLKIYKKKGDNQFILYSQTEKEILTKTIKLNEEVGELCNDILSVLKLQRKSKLDTFDKKNFPEEFADVIITTLLLANDAGVEVQKAIEEKMKKLKKGIQMQNNNSFDRIYEIVKKIPKGKVMTYKQVSILANVATPRVVGFALHVNKDPKNIPCHRVVFADGSLTPGYAFGGEDVQRKKLQDEGVLFTPKEKVNLSASLYKTP